MKSNQQNSSLDIPASNLSQIDFAHLQRLKQQSVQPDKYEPRNQFVPSQMQQYQTQHAETQHSIDPHLQAHVQQSTISPTVGRYRKGMQHAPTYHYPVANVYSNRVVPNVQSETKRHRSVRHPARQLIPLASTSAGGSNLRGRKLVLT